VVVVAVAAVAVAVAEETHPIALVNCSFVIEPDVLFNESNSA
jgi:hypothetical protein